MTDDADRNQTLAAVDLGSNSFHMVVAEERQGELHVLDRLRERIGLAEGLNKKGELDEEVAQRALGCLQRFGDRLHTIPKHRVRAVGTATFRNVRDGRYFLKRAQRCLGHKIETLPGKEEARLIYLGVAHSLGDDKVGRLVIDIGGASTEMIVGRRFESLQEASVSLGCILQSKKFFSSGEFSRKAFQKSILDARLELQAIAEDFQDFSWKQVVGASGTILAVETLIANHCKRGPGIRPETLDELIDLLCAAGHADRLQMSDLAEDRRLVLAGGLSIMRALCEEFHIESMETASGALREGLLYHLLGRLHHEDVRHRSVSALALRFRARSAHNDEVRSTAAHLFDQVEKDWELKRRHRRYLDWSCALFDIGMAVSYSNYHRHGAYIVRNSDMPGFSQEGQAVLAELLRCQRKRVRRSDFDDFDSQEQRRLQRLATLLRIARRLHRVRAEKSTPHIAVQAKGSSLRLQFPEGWIDQHALIQEDLSQEAELLKAWGIDLRIA